jgi:hypothetical protein
MMRRGTLALECREGWSARTGTPVVSTRRNWPRRGTTVATSDEVRQTALDLAEREIGTEQAVRELLACCGDHRVSVVRARQTLSEGELEDRTVTRAIEFLDEVLERGAWA